MISLWNVAVILQPTNFLCPLIYLGLSIGNVHAAEVVENLEAIGGVMGHGLVMDTA